jgi:hypothetical protein
MIAGVRWSCRSLLALLGRIFHLFTSLLHVLASTPPGVAAMQGNSKGECDGDQCGKPLHNVLLRLKVLRRVRLPPDGVCQPKRRKAARGQLSGVNAANDQRLAMGCTSRLGEPSKSWRGRPILYSGSPIISLSWAIQPTVRASAKMAVNSGTGMPIARCTMPE